MWADHVHLSGPDVPAPYELARAARRGELVRLRRGRYLSPAEVAPTAAQRHRQLIRETMPLLAAGSVASHLSAAVLHGLPVWDGDLGRVHVTRRGTGSGKRRGYVHQHVAPLAAEDVVLADGVPATSLARTVVDLARTLTAERAVAAGDAALRAGLTRAELDTVLDRSKGWPGLTAARRVVAFLDPRSESAGESASRVVLYRIGLPPSDLQLVVCDPSGAFVGRSDFGWREQRVLGEFDGRVKYTRSSEADPVTVVYGEKQREDALRDLGYQMVRWTTVDLQREDLLKVRLLRAMHRSRLSCPIDAPFQY